MAIKDDNKKILDFDLQMEDKWKIKTKAFQCSKS